MDLGELQPIVLGSYGPNLLWSPILSAETDAATVGSGICIVVPTWCPNQVRRSNPPKNMSLLSPCGGWVTRFRAQIHGTLGGRVTWFSGPNPCHPGGWLPGLSSPNARKFDDYGPKYTQMGGGRVTWFSGPNPCHPDPHRVTRVSCFLEDLFDGLGLSTKSPSSAANIAST
jgi:hypothetical protein